MGSAVADMFMDPLMSKSPSLVVAYKDNFDLWSIFEDGFLPTLPLPRTEWSPPKLPTTYVIPELGLTAVPEEDPGLAFPNSPVHWYRRPFVFFLIVKIEPADTTTPATIDIAGGKQVKTTRAEVIKQHVRAWCEDMSAKSNEWLVVYMPARSGKDSRSLVDAFRALAGAQRYSGTSLGQSFYSSMFSTLRAECGTRRDVNRFLRIDHYEHFKRKEHAARQVARMPGSPGGVSSSGLRKTSQKAATWLGARAEPDPDSLDPATQPFARKLDSDTQAELEKQWADLLSRVHVAVYESLTSRVRAHEEELKRLHDQHYQPRWNFCHYFCVKESLAFIFAQVRSAWHTRVIYVRHRRLGCFPNVHVYICM